VQVVQEGETYSYHHHHHVPKNKRLVSEEKKKNDDGTKIGSSDNGEKGNYCRNDLEINIDFHFFLMQFFDMYQEFFLQTTTTTTTTTTTDIITSHLFLGRIPCGTLHTQHDGLHIRT